MGIMSKFLYEKTEVPKENRLFLQDDIILSANIFEIL